MENNSVGEDEDSGELVGEHELHHRQDDFLNDVQLRVPENDGEREIKLQCWISALHNG